MSLLRTCTDDNRQRTPYACAVLKERMLLMYCLKGIRLVTVLLFALHSNINNHGM